MGFRSTLITQHNYLPLPKWFVKKYKGYLYINKNGLPMSSKFEFKTYFPTGEELPADIQKAMNECSEEVSKDLVFIWLHECGGITRVEINKDKITYSEPTEWEITEGVTHDYCYGCSDVEKLLIK